MIIMIIYYLLICYIFIIFLCVGKLFSYIMKNFFHRNENLFPYIMKIFFHILWNFFSTTMKFPIFPKLGKILYL